MPLTTTREMLLHAQANRYAVCAFNAENLEMVQAIVWGAQAMNAPAIIQTTPSTVRYADLSYFYAMVSAAAKNASVPIALHLDHGDSFALACRAFREQYSSVMIDGSHLSFEENIALTQQVVAVAKTANVPVEAELGTVGGKEDDREAREDGGYTDPDDAVTFVSQTGVDSLAVGIGTAHGFYKIAPVLDINRLTQIHAKVTVPLVLHGATGLDDEVIKACIKNGICKVNFATELRAAFTNAVRSKLTSDDSIVDVKVYSRDGRDAVMALVKRKIEISGSTGRIDANGAFC